MLAQMAEVKHRREGHPESETSRAEHEGDRIRPRVTGFSGVNAVVSVSLSPGTAPARLIVSASLVVGRNLYCRARAVGEVYTWTQWNSLQWTIAQ